MTEYSVEITDAAFVAIRDHARHIAIERAAPENAKRWLQRVWDAIDSLERWPRRAAKAPEDAFVPYEVRQLVLESHLLLFTIDDEQLRVWILGLRQVLGCPGRRIFHQFSRRQTRRPKSSRSADGGFQQTS